MVTLQPTRKTNPLKTIMKVNEIFYSVQGEGCFTGTPAVFLRLSDCNMKCDFCDTRHHTFKEMSEEEIIHEVSNYPSRHIVITGGEPTLQITSSLCRKLHDGGFFIQIETNGSLKLPADCSIDWITCSPKNAEITIQRIDELKVVYWGQDISRWEQTKAKEHRLQPLDRNDPLRNKEILHSTFEYILNHPMWSLSLQTHKMINVR